MWSTTFSIFFCSFMVMIPLLNFRLYKVNWRICALFNFYFWVFLVVLLFVLTRREKKKTIWSYIVIIIIIIIFVCRKIRVDQYLNKPTHNSLDLIFNVFSMIHFLLEFDKPDLSRPICQVYLISSHLNVKCEIYENENVHVSS